MKFTSTKHASYFPFSPCEQNIPCAAAQIAGEAMNVKKPADYSVMYRKLTEILA